MDKRKSFKELMDENPFDNIEVGIDSRYVDASVGYDRQKGTFAKLTIDLNTVGQKSEKEYNLEMERLKLQQEQAKLSRLAAMAKLSGNEDVANQISTTKQEPTTVTKTIEATATVSIKTMDEDTVESVDAMGAKAFFEDDE